MKKIKLTIAYDGTGFCGWQIQKNGRSVQQEIEKILKVIHDSDIKLTGSGRTDAGVHARGQVAHFSAPGNISADRYLPALNTRLPDDIKIINAEQADSEFHARYSAVRRCYKYYISPEKYPDIFRSRYCTGIGRYPDIKLLNRFASQIVGVHDFTTFAAAGDKSKSKTREIYSAGFFYENDMIVFKIKGNAFLWRMVRSLVGTILKFEEKGKQAAEMVKVLAAGDRTLAGVTAPAKGLFLERVDYD